MFGFEDPVDTYALTGRTRIWFERQLYGMRPDWCSKQLWDCIHENVFAGIHDMVRNGDDEAMVVTFIHNAQLVTGNIVPVQWIFIRSLTDAPVFIAAKLLPAIYALKINQVDGHALRKACRRAPLFHQQCTHPESH